MRKPPGWRVPSGEPSEERAHLRGAQQAMFPPEVMERAEKEHVKGGRKKRKHWGAWPSRYWINKKGKICIIWREPDRAEKLKDGKLVKIGGKFTKEPTEAELQKTLGYYIIANDLNGMGWEQLRPEHIFGPKRPRA